MRRYTAYRKGSEAQRLIHIDHTEHKIKVSLVFLAPVLSTVPS